LLPSTVGALRKLSANHKELGDLAGRLAQSPANAAQRPHNVFCELFFEGMYESVQSDVLMWLSEQQVAALQATCTAMSRLPSLEMHGSMAAQLVAPGRGLVRPSLLSWVAVHRRAVALVAAWGQAEDIEAKIRRCACDMNLVLDLAKDAAGPPITIVVIALVEVLRRQILPYVVNHLQGRNSFRLACAAEILASMAVDPTSAVPILQAGAEKQLVKLLGHKDATVREAASMALAVLVRVDPTATMAVRLAGGVSPLARLARCNEESEEVEAWDIASTVKDLLGITYPRVELTAASALNAMGVACCDQAAAFDVEEDRAARNPRKRPSTHRIVGLVRKRPARAQ